MRKIILLAGIVMMCMFSQVFGFATLLSGGGDTITFTTNVSGVDVLRNGVPIANIAGTMHSIKIKREKGDTTFIFRKEGYHDQPVVLGRSMSPFFLGNIFIGGVWGSSTDSIFTDNYMEYSPQQYYIQMTKK
ncbi:hypothetical protein NO1_1663 [Candidatus Termititenax aidoneus]|uniref:PEGA domain-containing protein n=1 Tax=Termititenax aidoneus TaxID=2218524 RepID=A0A388TCC9_TERA1|nr:hypothetical protein NO1_1663 [Candidatus Termititenax aidoneus]